MRITRIKLTNFGPHKNWELKDIKDKPIIEIIGLNGSGKSHILHALKYAFTGDLTGKTESYITVGEKTGEVLVEFEKEGIKGTIVRSFNANLSKRSFTWGDDAPITAASAVEKKLEEVLGADKQTIINAVFIEQGEIAGLLADTAAQRIAIFSKLLNLHFIDKRIRNVDGWLDRLKKGVRDLRPAQDQLKSNKETVTANIAEQSKQLDLLTSKCGGIDKINEFLDCFADYEKQLQLCEQAESRVHSVAMDLNQTASDKDNDVSWKDYIEEQKEAKKQCESELSKLADDIAAAKNSKQVIENVKRFLKDQDTYYDTLAKVERLKKLFVNVPPTRAKELREAAKETVKLHDSIKELQAKLNELEDALPQARSAKEKIEEEISTIQKDISEVNQKIEFSKNVRLNLVNFLEAKKKLKDKLSKETVICPSCGLKLLSGQEITDEALHEQQTQIDFFTSTIRADEQKLQSLNGAFSAAKSNLLIADRNIALKENQISQIQDTIKTSQEKHDVLYSKFNADSVFSFYAAIVLDSDIAEYDQVINYTLPSLKDLTYPGKLPEGFVGNVTMDGDKYIVDDKDLSEEAIEDNLKELYNKYEAADKDLSDMVTKLVAVEHLSKELKDAETEYKKCQAVLEKHPLKHELPTMSQRVLLDTGNNAVNVKEELNRIKEQFIQITAVINSHKATLQGLEAQEQELKRLENENLKTYEAIAELEKIKTLITPKTGITKDYLNYLFNIVTNYVSNYLAEMESNFVIDIEDREDYEDLSFKFRRLDGSSDAWLPMNKLSGGQKIKLAIAFLLSIQKIICPDLCFLVLDEPSTHLDTPSIIALKNLLRSMNESMNQGDGQIWIVDHSSELKDDPAWDFNPEE